MMLRSPAAADSSLDALVADCWPRAVAHWSRFLLLKHPVANTEQPTVAHINLNTRQIGLHYGLIREKNLMDCVEAILAHEVGHHVRWPGSLVVEARLRLLEKQILPLEHYSLTNMFTDLLINDALRPRFEEQFVRVYQALRDLTTAEPDPAFQFYLAVYEERWQREPGLLLGAGHETFAEKYPSYRADAQVLGQNLFHLGPNLYTQFLYFVSIVSRYVAIPKEDQEVRLLIVGCKCDDPSAEDWAEALSPNAAEREAIRRAMSEGWIRKQLADEMLDKNGLARRIRGLPGMASFDSAQVPEIMAAYYRREAERWLIRPPPQLMMGEAVTATTLEEWEPDESPREIDWPATLTQRGPIYGAALPLKRLRVAEAEGWDVPLWQPRIEIYLDVSGSMPDPRFTQNAMTLAAQILATAAIRAGGLARAVLYSGAPVTHWEWCRSEIELSRFLMHYVGGGTVYPFDLLRRSLEECRDSQPIRVIITDQDFHKNYEECPAHAEVFAEASRLSPHLILMLHASPEEGAAYRRVGAEVIPVPDLEDYPAMASGLATALFEGDRRVDY
jgi:hypothetical protein